MRFSQWRTADSWIGKGLILGRAVSQVSWFVMRQPSRASLRLARRMLRIMPGHTMVAPARLVNLHRAVEVVEREGLPGDLVECGSWNGGSAAILGAACERPRTVWVFDSFEGLPAPDARDGATAQQRFFPGWCKGDPARVRAAFRKLGVPEARLRIVPGWFQDTLPGAAVGPIAVLHVDADWYESVRCVLHAFYDRVVPGGVIVMDDYVKWEGCRRALHEFFEARGLHGIPLHPVDGWAVYFRKPQAPASAPPINGSRQEMATHE